MHLGTTTTDGKCNDQACWCHRDSASITCVAKDDDANPKVTVEIVPPHYRECDFHEPTTWPPFRPSNESWKKAQERIAELEAEVAELKRALAYALGQDKPKEDDVEIARDRAAYRLWELRAEVKGLREQLKQKDKTVANRLSRQLIAERDEARIAARYIFFGYEPKNDSQIAVVFRKRWPWLFEGDWGREDVGLWDRGDRKSIRERAKERGVDLSRVKGQQEQIDILTGKRASFE